MKTKKSLKNRFNFNLLPSIVALVLIVIVLLVSILKRIDAAEQRLISFSVLAIIGGAIFESMRISKNWKKLFFNLLLAFAFSFLCFMPGKKEVGYDFDMHIAMWPYYFLGIFVLISIAIHDEKITKSLDEGVTLIQSIAVLYWIYSENMLTDANPFLKSIAALSVLFALYSIFHAFTYTVLTDRHRFILSIGSSFIMVFFAADYTISIFQNGDISEISFKNEVVYHLFQYFLLGVSSIYAAHNLFMLIQFLPDRQNGFNKQYVQNVKDLKAKHVQRYSDSQVKISVSVIFVLLSGFVFGLNEYFKLVSSHTAIWILFVSFPVIAFVQGKAPQSAVKQASSGGTNRQRRKRRRKKS